LSARFSPKSVSGISRPLHIHFNPVKHGLVERVADWPHSSFDRYVKNGLVRGDWACSTVGDGDFGE
ncbi:hypothetical protein ACQKEJ_22440, partial [Stutzerimonas stutzeri]